MMYKVSDFVNLWFHSWRKVDVKKALIIKKSTI